MTPRPDKPRAGRLSLRFLAGLCACLSLPLVLATQLPLAPAVALPWDLANGLGYLALACCLLLFVYTGRPRQFPPFNGRFFANLHRHLGYIVLLLAVGHIALLLAIQPLLLEHLKISAPLYMLAGLLGAVLLLVLTILSLTRVRRRLWPDFNRFRSLHGWLALSCVCLMLWHVAGSHFYVNTLPKLLLGGACCALLLGGYLRKRLLNHPHRQRWHPLRLRDTGAYAYPLSYGALLLLLLTLAGLLMLRVVE